MPDRFPEHAVNALAAHIQTLYFVGARNFLVPNMLDLSLAPSALALTPAQQAGLQLLSAGFNGGLDLALIALGGLPGINITKFDTFGFNHAAFANPAAFGLTNVTAQCLSDVGVPCASPDQYLYWGGAHPTTRAHQYLGEEFYEAVATPEPSSLLMLLDGLTGLAVRARAHH